MLEVHTIQGRNKDHYEFSCESLDSLDINKLIPNVEYYIIKPGYYLLGMCMLKNNKNGAKIEWLTNRKAAWRFMTAGFNKRDFFKEK